MFGPPGPPGRFGGPVEPYDQYFISADGRVFRTPEEAIAAGLSAEDVAGTGVGCSQSPDNLPPPAGS